MNFYEVVDKVVDLLKQRGRTSYRALKVQFKLDDEAVEALKEEIIKVHQLAVDHNREMMIWVGETGNVPESTSQPEQIIQPDTQETQPPETHTPDTAERRQLTVMFCDLVGSTSLSGQLDPEDLRDVVREYQKGCTEVIQRYDGHVAQLLGDGLLVYFGYPQAHEDDAQRAIHAGLGILSVIETLNVNLEPNKGVELAVRLGVHTGLVVVGEMGGEGRQEQLALGETPNLAARIQGVAEPDTVVISADTYRLIQGYFECEALGERELRGVSQPVAVYQVIGDSGIQSRIDVASTRGLTPLVGREQEVGLLLERWEQAQNRQGQVVLLSGEGGIGKSRLVQVLKDRVADEPHTRLECRSSPYFANSALYPIIDMMQRTLRFQADETPEAKLEKLEQNLCHYRLPREETVPLLSALLSLSVPEDRYPPLNWPPQRQRQKTLEAIVAIILEMAEQQPVLLILEDAHWVDASTQELLDLLIDQVPMASILILVTYRPEFQPTWGNRSYLTPITLNRLSRSQIESIAIQVAGGKELPSEVMAQLAERTDGVPLYVEEMTKSVLESGVLKEMNGQYALTDSIATLSIPATLQDSLMARLDRLVTAKTVAQYASVIGRQFSYELLQAVLELDEETLQRELERLVEAELLYQRGLPPQAMYIFKHALIQDTAYESLLRSTKQTYHRHIAEVLTERFPEAVENQPELLAHHYTEARMNEQAVGYWHQAGERAVGRSAHLEVLAHMTKGVTLLESLPDTPGNFQIELEMQVALGAALMATKGFGAPEVGQSYRRAHELCEKVGATPQLFDVLYGLRRFYASQGDLRRAQDIAEQQFNLANGIQEIPSLLEAYYSLGFINFLLGDLESASHQLTQSVALDEQLRKNALDFSLGRTGARIGLCCRTILSIILWVRGYPSQALKNAGEVVHLSREEKHIFTMTYVLGWSGMVYCYCRDLKTAKVHAQELMYLCQEYNYSAFEVLGLTYYGWVLYHQGEIEEGISLVRQVVLASRGNKIHSLVLLAEMEGEINQYEEALRHLDEALDIVGNNRGGLWEAEIHRLKGELIFHKSPGNAAEAESCFHQAISIAQNQQAKSWELRATTSLARLWQSQGKRNEAHELLSGIYGWFSEGFNTADLIDAKTLLDELS